MTEIVLENIDMLNDLKLFSDAYKKGHIKMNGDVEPFKVMKK